MRVLVSRPHLPLRPQLPQPLSLSGMQPSKPGWKAVHTRSCATRSRSTTASLGPPNQPERSLGTGLPVDYKRSRDLTGPLTRSTASFTVLRDPPNLLLQPSQIHHCARELSAARSHQPSKKSTLSSTVSPRSWTCSISWFLYIRSLHVCI